MGQRRKARERALQILFQLEFHSADPKEIAAGTWAHQDAPRAVREYANWLVERFLARRDDVDRTIQAASKNWRLARMAVVDRNILRIAVVELLEERTLAPAIVIDEAIEIAKRYSGEESAVFVNGVLDAVVRDLKGPQGGSPRPEKRAAEGDHGKDRRPLGK